MIFLRIRELFTNISEQCFLFFPHTVEVKPILAQRGSSDKSVFLHKAPSVKSTPPSSLLFHRESSAWKHKFHDYSGNIYWRLCVPLLCFSFIWSSEMSLVWYTSKQWVAHNPVLHSWLLNFVLFLCLWWNTHCTKLSHVA